MRKISKLMALCCVFTLCVCMFTVPTYAATSRTKGMSGSSHFTDEWEKTTSYFVGNTKIGYMIWGYDTDWIREDYVWTVGLECGSQAAIKRNYYDTGYLNGTWNSAYLYGKQELSHKTYDVSYKIIFDSTYSGITESTSNSSVK